MVASRKQVKYRTTHELQLHEPKHQNQAVDLGRDHHRGRDSHDRLPLAGLPSVAMAESKDQFDDVLYALPGRGDPEKAAGISIGVDIAGRVRLIRFRFSTTVNETLGQHQV